MVVTRSPQFGQGPGQPSSRADVSGLRRESNLCILAPSSTGSILTKLGSASKEQSIESGRPEEKPQAASRDAFRRGEERQSRRLEEGSFPPLHRERTRTSKSGNGAPGAVSRRTMAKGPPRSRDRLIKQSTWHRCPGKRDEEKKEGVPKASSERDEGQVHLEHSQKKRRRNGAPVGQRKPGGGKSPNRSSLRARVGRHPIPRRSTPGRSSSDYHRIRRRHRCRVKQAMGGLRRLGSENGTQKVLSGSHSCHMKEFTEDIQADNPGATGGEGGEGPGDASTKP
ncbi:hypothetical protein GWK47_052679 [Chionoecetes opilio]|uniref:Uncharacterized protein n=1 Tax=Chionoecetes opilio TaxID=41210 RepID=A0A8J4Y8P6_CHIOP|nr:hypothetical protein GWK47_052679 [Chionoecetes opilio]